MKPNKTKRKKEKFRVNPAISPVVSREEVNQFDRWERGKYEKQ